MGQQPFTAGNIVVYRVGDGTATLNNTAAKVYVDEYTPAGVLVQSIPMPASANGANNIFTAAGNQLDGMMTLSANGKYLILPGSNTPVGAVVPGGSAVVIGRVDFNADVNTSTAITDYTESTNFLLYGAVSNDGDRFWFGRFNALRTATIGSNTSTVVAKPGDFINGLTIADGQLYMSVDNPNPRIMKVGTGLPVTGLQTSTGLPGLVSASARSPKQFAFADLDLTVPGVDVLYIADFGTSTGGIRKFSLVSGNWADNGVIGTAADGYAGLTISVLGSSVTIFATRRGVNTGTIKGGELVKLTDNSGYNGALSGTPAVIASVATPNTMSFRGVANVPQPAAFTAGNIVVYRVGDGTTVLNNTAARVYLDEYTPGGGLVQSIAMPTATSGSNNTFTACGNQLDGIMTLSANEKYLILPGSNTPVGAVVPGGSAVVIGRIDYNGNTNTSTAITDYIESNNFLLYGAVSDDGNRFWFSRYNALRTTTIGSTTSTVVAKPGDYINGLAIADGQLYMSGDNPSPKMLKVGTGLPVTGLQTSTGLPGLVSTSARSPKQFAFADLEPTIPGVDVLYIADYGPGNGAGLKKLSLVNGNWTDNGVIGTAADGYAGVTLSVSGGAVTIFATRRGSNTGLIKGGELVKLTDNSGYNGTLSGTPTVIASVTTPNTMSFRGVAKTPQACKAVSALQAINVTSTQATITWVATNGETNFEYAVTSVATPPASGSLISNTSVTVTGLQNGNTYYAYVRSKCSANPSEWNVVQFVTDCKPPAVTLLNVSIAGSGITTINWNNVFGATSYEYQVSTSAIPPASGIAITDTATRINNLNAVSQYFVHVRSICDAGATSSWVSKGFTTGCFVPTPNVSVSPDNAGARWNIVTNAVRYEYALTYNAAKPTSGSYTTDTFYLIHKEANGAGYYFHVRSICNNGVVSEWGSAPFNMNGMLAYPSPVQETLKISLYGINDPSGEIVISDAMGRIVNRSRAAGSITTVYTNAWAAGVYFIRYNDGKNSYTVRVFKK